MSNTKVATKVRKKDRKVCVVGVVHINATFNNTIIAVTDLNGDVLAWSSTGKHGFKGARKGTPYAAQVVAEDVAKMAREKFEMKTIGIEIKGPGAGRESAIRAFQTFGFVVTYIKDLTSVPHNGCRPRKRRRA